MGRIKLVIATEELAIHSKAEFHHPTIAELSQCVAHLEILKQKLLKKIIESGKSHEKLDGSK